MSETIAKSFTYLVILLKKQVAVCTYNGAIAFMGMATGHASSTTIVKNTTRAMLYFDICNGKLYSLAVGIRLVHTNI